MYILESAAPLLLCVCQWLYTFGQIVFFWMKKKYLIGFFQFTFLALFILGAAMSDLIFGSVSPSGKLAETFPLSVQDVASDPHFGRKGDKIVVRVARGGVEPGSTSPRFCGSSCAPDPRCSYEPLNFRNKKRERFLPPCVCEFPLGISPAPVLSSCAASNLCARLFFAVSANYCV